MTVKKLDQNKYKARILQDLGMVDVGGKKPVRMAIFECENCKNGMSKTVYKMKKSDTGSAFCRKCIPLNGRKRKLLPLKQKDYRIQIVNDLGVIDGVRRVEVMCDDCSKITIKSASEAKQQTTPYCATCSKKHKRKYPKNERKTHLYFQWQYLVCKNKRPIPKDWNDYIKYKTFALSHGYQEGYGIRRRNTTKPFSVENVYYALPKTKVK